jgi:hypothetical protein
MGTGAVNAESQLANLGQAQFQIPQQAVQDLESYLGLGQSASTISGNLGQLGQNQLGSSLAGIGSALGAGNTALFGSQGIGGANGLLGAGGLLSGLGGAASAAPLVPGVGGAFATLPFTDLGAGAATAATAGAGGGADILGSLLPAAASA